MEKNLPSKSAKMPMLELILMIGVFAIISTFLLEMFLVANTLQEKAKDRGKAVLLSETIAETIKGSDNLEQGIQAMKLKSLDGQGTGYGMYLDKKWNAVEQESAYLVRLCPVDEAEEGLETYEVYVERSKGYTSLFSNSSRQEIYRLTFSKYRVN